MTSVRWDAIIVLALIVVLGLYFFVGHFGGSAVMDYDDEAPVPSEVVSSASQGSAVSEVNLLLSRDGFSPSEVHVIGGQQVRLSIASLDDGFNAKDYVVRISGQNVSGSLRVGSPFSVRFTPTHYGYYPIYWTSGVYEGHGDFYVDE